MKLANNRHCWVLLALLLLSGAAYGWNLPLTYENAHSLGMGGVCVSVCDNEQALHTNPAALALRETSAYSVLTPFWAESRDFDKLNSAIGGLSDADTAFSRADNMQRLISVMGKNGFRRRGNSMYYTGKAGFGVSLYYMDTESYFVENPVNPRVGSRVDKDLVLSASFAKALADDHQLFKDKTSAWLGGSMKVATRKRAITAFSARDFSALTPDLLRDTDSSGTALDFDLGGIWQLNNPYRPSIGFFVGNILGSKFSSDAGKLERQLGLGVSVRPLTGDLERNERITLAAEYFDEGGIGGFFTKLRFGGEVKLMEGLKLSAGLRSGYPTVGFAFDWRDVRLNAALYSEELGERVGDLEDKRYAISGSLEF